MKKVALLLAAVLISPLFAETNTERIDRLEKLVEKLERKAKHNLHFNVDYRVTHDQLSYTMVDGSKFENKSLLSNRLILGMGYVYNKNLSFSSNLGYQKAFGASSDGNQRTYLPGANNGFAYFDWITNENLTDNSVKVKEASFLYRNKTFWTMNIPWTFSLGRRPSTNGFLITHREGYEKPKSPLGHAINAEYDGMSIGFKLENITGIEGSAFKICAGRGLSNATARYAMQEGSTVDYYNDQNKSQNIDMGGFIATFYNDGEYHLKSMLYHAKNLIGMGGTLLTDFGDLTGVTISFEMNGLSDYNDFLDDTIFFASYSTSQTHPEDGMAMIGDIESKKGHSYWAGLIFPWFFKDGDSLGIEYNHGSRYWRSFTYAEDTIIGSKIAARGSAYEAYYNLPLIDKAFTFQLRYTYIKYDYSGSNGFFGDTTGTPVSIDQMKGTIAAGINAESAQALRAMFRYKF